MRCLRSLKKPAASKRTNLPRRVDYARLFLKDWKRLSRSGRYDMNRLKAVMLHLIANDAPLGPERRDHALKGAWADYRECHIGGDFLLIYRVDDTDGPGGSVYFARAGTHAELFN
ncbi:type II toxin-antitoxin system YafQ family toxin [Candidatus Palauibacter sp.]|uniref:type II toxin-antitoxin system YafQ family toxin n=1 Tax=Candidatus Palauibacter sp. TaxID=3101350 RepID=UPI003B013D49